MKMINTTKNTAAEEEAAIITTVGNESEMWSSQ